MKQFKLEMVLDHPVNIEVNIYKNSSSMKNGIINAGFKYLPKTRAQVCPVMMEKVVPMKRSKFKHSCIVFLNEDYLGVRVITHEALHIALWVLRTHNKSIKLGKEIDEKEERIAYFLGEVMRLFVLNFEELGYYDK